MVFLYMLLTQHILMATKDKRKMFRGKNMIEIKMWWQRSETGNFFYHVVTMGALLSYFF